jgi:hypothetical protein
LKIPVNLPFPKGDFKTPISQVFMLFDIILFMKHNARQRDIYGITPACRSPWGQNLGWALLSGEKVRKEKGKPRMLFFQSSDRNRPSWLNC